MKRFGTLDYHESFYPVRKGLADLFDVAFSSSSENLKLKIRGTL